VGGKRSKPRRWGEIGLAPKKEKRGGGKTSGVVKTPSKRSWVVSGKEKGAKVGQKGQRLPTQRKGRRFRQ